jgi:hypothetical protein
VLARAVLIWCLVVPLVPAWAGTISGTITEAAGGAPIAGFEVHLLSASGGKGWAIVDVTTTNGAGGYSFLALGAFIVQAAPPFNYPPQCFYAHRYYDVAAPFAGGGVDSAADVLTLAGTTNLTGIDIRLDLVGRLEGTVTQGSVGLTGVRVRVEEVANWRQHVDGLSAAGPTLGSFRVCGVDPGPQRLWIHHPSALYEDLLPGPYTVASGAITNVGSLAMAPIASDPYEPNSSPASGTSLPASPNVWESSGAILTPLGSDVDFYCFDALAGDRYVITTTTGLNVGGEPRHSPWVDPMLGWFATSPAQLLVSNDDDPSGAGPFNARLDTGVVSADGRYCVGVTSYADPDFNGSGQSSAGRYGLRVASETIFADGFESLP